MYGTEHELIQEIIHSGNHVSLTRWFSVSLTIFIWDNILTLNDEIRFIWPRKWSSIKLCIYANRILCFSALVLNVVQLDTSHLHLDLMFCTSFFYISGYFAYASFGACNWVLLVRAHALLGAKRDSRIWLCALFAFTYGATAFLVVIATIQLQGQIYYSTDLKACSIQDLPPVMPFLWIPAAAFETVVFSITVSKVYRSLAVIHSLGSDLFLVLFRDGVVYFLVILLLRVANILSWLFLPASYAFAGLFILFSVMSVSITRLQLNLMKSMQPNVG